MCTTPVPGPLRVGRTIALAALATLGLAAGTASAAPVHWSFEDGTTEGWRLTAGVPTGPLVDDRPRQRLHRGIPVNREGRFNLTTEGRTPLDAVYDRIPDNLRGMDLVGLLGPGPSASTATLESPRFTLERPVVSLLAAGGTDRDAYVSAHLDDGTEIARTTGGPTEVLGYRQLDLSRWIGRTVFLRVVDRDTGPWDLVAIDDVRANVPAMPRDLRARRVRGRAVVTWTPLTEPGIAGYRVEHASRRTGPFTALRGGLVRAGRVEDPGAPRDAERFYRVTAVATDGTESEGNVGLLRRVLELRARGRTVTYTGGRMSAIAFPVGAIGSGGVVLFGDGTRNQSWIFNIDGELTSIFPGRREAMVPNSFLAVRARPRGGTATVRALQTTSEGAFAPMRSLTFQGEYPLARYRFIDEQLPVEVREEVTSPTIPGDIAASSYPTALTTVTVRNPGSEPVEVSLLATQQNAVGLDGRGEVTGPQRRSSPAYGANVTELAEDAEGATLRMRGCRAGRIVDLGVRCNGSLALSLLHPPASGTASWATSAALLDDFRDDGTVRGPRTARSPAPGRTVDGALSATVELAPGETVRFPVVFSWYVPTGPLREFGGQGQAYTTRWRDAFDVHAEVLREREDLERRTRAFHAAMHDTNIPQYVLDRVTAPISVLRSPTVFWARNGFFGGWEGFGCCTGMPTHVWHYAQSGPRLWPQIGRMWVSQWLDATSPEGLIPYRYTVPTFSMDGQTGVLLSAYRYVQDSGDLAWLRARWGTIASAMEYVVRNHDPDMDGLLTGPQPTTLDTTETGTGSWLGTLYLAALRATARMATLAGDEARATRYARIARVGGPAQDALLFNGEYHSEKPESGVPNSVAYGDGAIDDMLLGQWWSSMLGLGELYDRSRMRASLRALYRHNFREDFLGDSPFGAQREWRVYTAPEEAGLLLMTWPRGNRPPNPPRYTDETWNSFEFSTAATMIQQGLLGEGLRIVRASADRADGRLRTDVFLGNCGTGDGTGNPFADGECGQWYGRTMSSWSLLTALQGSTVDVAEGRLGFDPGWRPGDHRSFFTAGEAWGTFAQVRRSGTQIDVLHVRSGALTVRRLDLVTARTGRVVARVRVRRAGARAPGPAVTARTVRDGRQVAVLVPQTVLRAGDRLAVTVG